MIKLNSHMSVSGQKKNPNSHSMFLLRWKIWVLLLLRLLFLAMLWKCSPAVLGFFFFQCPFLFIREYYSYKSKKPQQTKATIANKHDNHNARRSTWKKAAQGWMPYAALFNKYLLTWIQTIVSYLQRSSLPTQYGLFIFSLGTWTAMLSQQY